MEIIQLILEIIILIIGLYLVFFKSYFSEKGKNLATQQDIKNITIKVEEVKAEIQNHQLVEKQKRELKYNAILKSLELIDARLSNLIIDPTIIKQYATTKETRECHSRLILTCNNSEIIKSFENIMMKNLKPDQTGTQFIMRELQNYRNFVRKELGFGEPIKIDPNLLWIGNVTYEEK